jgi:hypothetical protein
MIRKFKFEDEIYESLNCLPIAARRKLDALGVKLSLTLLVVRIHLALPTSPSLCGFSAQLAEIACSCGFIQIGMLSCRGNHWRRSRARSMAATRVMKENLS